MKKLSLLTLLSVSIFASWAQNIDEKKLKDHIYYLASDKLKGRAPGTKGEAMAYTYIEKQFKSYGLTPKGEDGYKQKFTYKENLNPHDSTAKDVVEKNGTNVIGYLDNGSANTIVIGAHFDHLGEGHSNSSLDKNGGTGIHNGADDNASGTAGVLELARYFSANNVKESYNLLFICFSAEEDGLIGSKYFTNHPTVKLENIDCMINMDMIGRLNDSTRKLLIFGVGTSPAFAEVFTIPNTFQLAFDSSGIGPSDQTSFYLKNIPVLHFFSGQHTDYHKSTDDADKINYRGEQEILEYMVKVIERINTLPKMAFTQTRQKEQERVSFKVTLGIMPDYAYQDKGVRVDAVNDGKPAQVAGIKAGDIIMAFDGEEVKDIYAYMKFLSKYKVGEQATVTVLRNNENVNLLVKF